MVSAETSTTAAATKKPRAAASGNPNTLNMVVEAITAINERKGASVPAIKSFIVDKYSTVDPNMLKYRLKRAIKKGLAQEILSRPKGMEEAGASLNGRFRVNKTKIAAMEKAKLRKPVPKAKPKAEKPKVKKPKPEKSTKSPKKVAKPKETKTGTGVKKTKDVKTKKPKAIVTKSPGKSKNKSEKVKKPKNKSTDKKTPKKASKKAKPS